MTTYSQKPTPVPNMWRVECNCGCGAWFYARRKPGRMPLYINVQHYSREKWRRYLAKRDGNRYAQVVRR